MTVLLSESENVQRMIDKLNNLKAGLEMNIRKINIRFINELLQQQIIIGNETSESVEEYILLGQRVSASPTDRRKSGEYKRRKHGDNVRSNLPSSVKRKTDVKKVWVFFLC